MTFMAFAIFHASKAEAIIEGDVTVYDDTNGVMKLQMGESYEQEISTKQKLQAADEATVAADAKAGEAIEKTALSEKSQADAARNGRTGTEGQVQQQITGAATGIIGCAGANILASLLTSTITSFLSQNISNITDSLMYVPTAVKGETAANIRTDTNSKSGTVISAEFGGFGGSAIVFPSWDSIAYCIVNEMITYIANSTIAWVKGGFEGNPAFVDNPGQFFQDVANMEASSFLQGRSEEHTSELQSQR